MPLLEPRPGANDGGYAVQDYGQVRADLGTMDDLADLAEDLHEAGIALTLDLVLNHVAREHAWARSRAAASSPTATTSMFFRDRTNPTATSAPCPRCSPTSPPATSRATTDLDGWVWTTFNN